MLWNITAPKFVVILLEIDCNNVINYVRKLISSLNVCIVAGFFLYCVQENKPRSKYYSQMIKYSFFPSELENAIENVYKMHKKQFFRLSK